MTRRALVWLVGALAALATLLAPAGAAAQSPDPRHPVALAFAGPADVPLGNQARLIARLRDGAGGPIAGARVVFTSPAAFAGTVGEMALGEATTDNEGTATLEYQLRIEGRNQFVARYYGDETRQPAEARAIVAATGTAQLAQRTAGVPFPLPINWTLIAVLAVVWAVYFLAMLRVAGIPEPTGAGGEG